MEARLSQTSNRSAAQDSRRLGYSETRYPFAPMRSIEFEYFPDDNVSLSSRRTMLEMEVVKTRSYACHIQYITEFLQNKAKQRADIVNKHRKQFGDYRDCGGMVQKPIYFSEKEKGVLSVRHSPNGKYVVAGFGSGTVNLYDGKLFSLERTILTGRENGYPITCVRFLTNNNNIFYASSSEGFILCYDISKENLSYVVGKKSGINAIDINCSNRNLLSGDSDHCVKVYDLETSILLSSYKNSTRKTGGFEYSFTEFHTNRVYAVKFFLDNPNTFLSGGWDNMLKMWDLRTKYGCVKTVFGPHISGDAIDIKDNTLLTGSWEAKNFIHIRDLRTFSLIQNVFPINSPKILEGVYTFSTSFFDSDVSGDLILHASLGYKSVDVISISLNVILQSFVSEQSCVTASSHGPHIVFGGTHNIFNFAVFYMNILVHHEDRPSMQFVAEEGEEEGEETEIEIEKQIAEVNLE